MTKEELLEKAKVDYPVGTKFNSTGGTDNCLITEKSTYSFDKDGDIVIHAKTGSVIGRVYRASKDKWAEILSKPIPKEPLLTKIL